MRNGMGMRPDEMLMIMMMMVNDTNAWVSHMCATDALSLRTTTNGYVPLMLLKLMMTVRMHDTNTTTVSEQLEYL